MKEEKGDSYCYEYDERIRFQKVYNNQEKWKKMRPELIYLPGSFYLNFSESK